MSELSVVILILSGVVLLLLLALLRTQRELKGERENSIRSREKLSAIEAELTITHSKLAESQGELSLKFKSMADAVVKESSDYLRESNLVQMQSVLTPLREHIHQFESRVVSRHESELAGRAELRGELQKLQNLNQQLGREAQGLVQALKGDNKQQGNWGEMVLEKVLERSGLTCGVEFEREVVTSNFEGDRIRPDVVIKLPEGKHLIIDSKVSLISYETYSSADSVEERDRALAAHIISIKRHIKTLSEKYYQSAASLNSPDFVLMFMPIESSFSAALKVDEDIFSLAWDKKIVIVSPTTLLATLKTVESIWRQENQTKNALAIARESGALYDKFVAFVEDMDKVERSLEVTMKHHRSALNKLSTGRGNLVKRAESIKEMGAKTTKALPEQYR